MKKTTFAMAVATANAVSLKQCECSDNILTTVGGQNILMPATSTITTTTRPFGGRKTTIVRSISPMPATQIVDLGYEQPLNLVNYNKSNLGLDNALNSHGAKIVTLGKTRYVSPATRYISPATRTYVTRSVSATRDFKPIGSKKTLFGPKVISMGGQRDASIISIASTDSFLGAHRVVRAVSVEQPGVYVTKPIRTPRGAIVHKKTTSVTKGLGGRYTAEQKKFTNKGLGRWETSNTSIERGLGKTVRAKSSSLERGLGGALKFKEMSVERDAFGNILNANNQQTIRGIGGSIATKKTSYNRGMGATVVRGNSFTRVPQGTNYVMVQEPATILDQNVLLGTTDYRYTTQRPSAIILDSDSAFGTTSVLDLGMACSESDSASSVSSDDLGSKYELLSATDLGALFQDQQAPQMIETNLGTFLVTPQGKYIKKSMGKDCDEGLGEEEESDDEGFGGQQCVCPGTPEENQCFCSCPSQNEDGECQLNNYMMGEGDVQETGTLLAQTEAGHWKQWGGPYHGNYHYRHRGYPHGGYHSRYWNRYGRGYHGNCNYNKCW